LEWKYPPEIYTLQFLTTKGVYETIREVSGGDKVFEMSIQPTTILGIQILMKEFSDLCEIPSGDRAYGLIHVKAFRGGKSLYVKPCDDGN